jgi:hypothetical protein
MKLEKLTSSLTYYIDMDNGYSYRRSATSADWERLWGESWEPVFSEEKELEQAFQDYVDSI